MICITYLCLWNNYLFLNFNNHAALELFWNNTWNGLWTLPRIMLVQTRRVLTGGVKHISILRITLMLYLGVMRKDLPQANGKQPCDWGSTRCMLEIQNFSCGNILHCFLFIDYWLVQTKEFRALIKRLKNLTKASKLSLPFLGTLILDSLPLGNTIF